MMELKRFPWKLALVLVIGSVGIFLVSIYPYFAINAYYGNLRTYKTLNGLSYLADLHPNDYQAIAWIQNNIVGQPIILEGAGESYTDYARISANTGLPTVIGWPVHEWLWRGTYDEAGKRVGEVEQMYTSGDLEQTKGLLKKYKVAYVYVGTLEKQKYPAIQIDKFSQLGKIIYQNGDTKIYKLDGV